jgi:hypothetical protein
MKKFFAILMIAGLCSLGAYFFATASSKPPVPDISASGQKIPVAQGSYCWKTFFTSKCVDWEYAPPAKVGDVHEPVEVAPHSKIAIHFEKEPVSLSVKRRMNEGKEINVKMIGKKSLRQVKAGCMFIILWRAGNKETAAMFSALK